MIPAWVNRYIGVPYEQRDCWELIRLIYREQFGISLSIWLECDRPRREQCIADVQMDEWLETDVEHACIGDVLGFFHRAIGWHAGLVIAPGWMIHTEEVIDCVRESYRQSRWLNRLAGCYRHKSLTAPDGNGARISLTIPR